MVCRRFTGGFLCQSHTGRHWDTDCYISDRIIRTVLLIRPLAQKKFNSGHIRTNAQTLIGEEAVVLEPINNLRSQGRVMIHGQEWAARSVDEKETFEKNAVVLVQSISGVKLMVTRSVGQ